jgi:hypothetical protein
MPEGEKQETYTKFRTDCKQEHAASLNCIHENYQNKNVCQPFFDSYKECRKAENERRLVENSQRGGSFW